MRVLYAYLCLLLLGFVSGKCVDINTPEIESRLNVSYDNNCYSHTKSKYECCSHFLLDDRCIDSYKECVQYKDYILDGIKDNCNGHQEELFNLTYSDKCHDFTLELEPKCCDNMSLPECTEWYSECHLHHHGEVHNESACSIPTKYTNTYCGDYVKHIDDNCCIDFNENCVGIYDWCVENSPNETSVLDLFLGPRIGYIMGDSHKVYSNVGLLELCAELCVQTHSCQSINYIEDYGQCHLNSHVIGDPGVEFMDDSDSVYYSKIYKMPIHNTLCNVKYDYWVGDGMCDKTGGYNTEECHYDGGDCCQETCEGSGLFGCGGIREFNCKDPSILNPTTISETTTTRTMTTTTITTTSRTTRTTTTTTGECHNGKIFSTCGSPCEATCVHPNTQCIQVCAIGCFCPKDKPIYDTKSNKCVTLGQCTTTSTTLTSTTLTSTTLTTTTSTTTTQTTTTTSQTQTTVTQTTTTQTQTPTTQTPTTQTQTLTTQTQTSTTGNSNSTTNQPITAIPNSSDKSISKDTNKVRTRNILLWVFIPIICILLLVGGVVYKRIINKRIRENGNTVNINEPNPTRTSFDNPVYNGQYVEQTSELYREVDTDHTDTQYGDVDVNYGNNNSLEDRNNDILPDEEEV